MKKQLIISMIIMAGSMGAKAEMTLSFTNGTGNATSATPSMTLNTETLVDSGVVALRNASVLSGTSTVNDEFSLDGGYGFGFDRDNPSWDTTVSTNDHRLRYNSNGLAPNGGTDQFATGEILWFTVSGLETGNSLKLSSYTLNGGLAKRVDFYYEQDGGGIQYFNTRATMPQAIDFTFSNDDKFGFAYYNIDTESKGNLGGITFDVIPEPATLGLVASVGIGVLFIRRRLMM